MSGIYVLVAIFAVVPCLHAELLNPYACAELTPGTINTILEVGRFNQNDTCVQELPVKGKTDKLLDYTDTFDVTKFEKDDEEYVISKIHVVKNQVSESSSPIKTSIVAGGLKTPTVTLRFIIAPGDFSLRVYLHIRKYKERCCQCCKV